MSISSEITRLQNAKADLKTALENKGVTVPSSATLDDYADLVDSIEAASQFDENADFCFWDYDGTPLYSYTMAEIQAMTELPAPPDHSQDDVPLTFLYWNWTLADLKSLNCTMDIGACYRPTDGKMHWTYRLTDISGLTCSFTTTQTKDVVIDWGDGTTPEHWGSSTENGANPTHTYAQAGTYHCTWEGSGRPSSRMRTEGNQCLVGQFVVGDNMMEVWLSTYWSETITDSFIETIVCNGTMTGGTNYIGPKPKNCPRLKAYVFTPISSVGEGVLQNCKALELVCFSNSSYQRGNNLCAGCYNLKRARLSPNSVYTRFAFQSCNLSFFNGPTLGYRSLQANHNLKRLVIKSDMGEDLFYASSSTNNVPPLEEIWCGLTTPPTLNSTKILSKITPWCKIHVPAEALTDWQEATNWSTYANYMVGDWTEDPIK